MSTIRCTTTTTGLRPSGIRVSRYHGALVQFRGLVALRLAGADVLPLDYEPYAWRIEEFTEEVERRWHRLPEQTRLRPCQCP